ncbi:hypothetical protein KBA39_06725 [Myxococcota bacterium]|nr:hypothetical protein [Myxococcota bacterium]
MRLPRIFKVLVLLLVPVSAGFGAGAMAADAEKRVDDPETRDWKSPYAEIQISGVAGEIHRDWSAGFEFILAGGSHGFHSVFVAPVRWDPDGIRARDWDEVNDFGRLVGRLAYCNESGDIDVELRSIRGYTLGAGNLVSMYNSTVDQDHWRTGLTARLHWPVAGADLFVDSFLGPSLLGARAYLRPLWFVDNSGNLGRLEIGASFAVDIFAPETMGSGTPERPGQVLPDRHGLAVSGTDTVAAWSVDLRWPVVFGDAAGLVPWVAWSRIGTADAFNMGVDLSVRLAPRWSLALSGGYDYMESGFASGYFDGLYMVDRYDFGVLRDAFPGAFSKQALLESTGVTRHGGSVGLGVFFDPWMSLWFRADIDENGLFSRFRAGASVSVKERLVLSGNMIARGFGPANDSLVADRVGGSVAADITVWNFIGVFFSYTRDLYVSMSGVDTGRYVGGDTGLAGVRMTFGLIPSDRGIR